MARLTAAKVREFSKPGRYGDGASLYLYIAKGGTKSWVMRLSVDGKRKDKGLGGFPSVSLSAARKLADSYRGQVADGRNPWEEVEQERIERVEVLDGIPTFKQAAHVHLNRLVKGGKINSDKHARNWIQMLERHVFPVFGDTPVDKIRTPQVIEIMDTVGPQRRETAKRLRYRMRKIFAACMASEYITVNPAGEKIDAAAEVWMKHKVQHFQALPYEDIPGVIDTIFDSQGMRETRLALAFQVLTAARSGEVRGATWEEIDLAAGVWNIPAERMKSDRPHRVPLSIQAKVLLEEAREAVNKRLKRRPTYNPNGLIFAHPSGKPLSE